MHSPLRERATDAGRSILRPSLVLLSAALLVLGLAVPVAAKGTIHVPLPTGDPTTDWNNIQSAVDSAGDGDTVQFGAGTYVLGDASEFIVVSVPEVRLVGSPDGTTILGGEVLPVPASESGAPYLYGNHSILRSPPRGFHLTAGEQQIADIAFEGFRTAVMVGFGDFASTGGYVVENCEFERTMYGVIAHVESEEESAIRHNAFINNTFPYTISGGLFRASDNYVASPDPEKIPIDNTHHAGTLSAGSFGFWEEGQARITEHNVFERNIVDGGVVDGYQIIADAGGVVRNNLFRDSEFYDITFFAGTFAVGLSFGGDIVDNIFVNNTLQGSGGTGFLLWNLGGGLIDGNLVVGNEMTSIAGFHGGVVLDGATNTVLLNNIITGLAPDPALPSASIYLGHSNQFLLNITDGDPAAWFYNSTDGLFASDDPADIAVDENGDPVESLDPYQDFTRLLRCERQLTDTESVDDFRECVNEALEELITDDHD